MKFDRTLKKVSGVVSAILFVAASCWYLGIPLASAQMVTLVAKYVTGALPLEDPNSTTWNSATPVTISLSAQNELIPTGGGSVTSLTARALNNATSKSTMWRGRAEMMRRSMRGCESYSTAGS